MRFSSGKHLKCGRNVDDQLKNYQFKIISWLFFIMAERKTIKWMLKSAKILSAINCCVCRNSVRLMVYPVFFLIFYLDFFSIVFVVKVLDSFYFECFAAIAFALVHLCKLYLCVHDTTTNRRGEKAKCR